MKVTEKIRRVCKLTDQLEEATRAGQPTEAIEKQFLQEGISADAVAEPVSKNWTGDLVIKIC
jgi:hypothetical protein